MATANLEKMQLADDLAVYANSGAEFETQFLYKEIFGDKCYDTGPLPEDAVIIDAGANIGMFSLYIKRKCPGARITAFEPAPDTAAALRLNLALHEVHGVEVHECALGSQDCEMKLTYFPNMPGNSTLHGDDEPAIFAGEVGRAHPVARLREERREVPVPVRRLSDVLRQMPGLVRVDLLKIDVEGAELDVLRGLDDDHWELVRRIVMEVGDEHGDLAAAETLLRGRGFDVLSERAAWAPETLPMYTLMARR
ncbi:hypothetical protein E4U19_006549 [Claviceps sp. Clav32 group G5]|nr:hypothetical protein E4U40_005480 [Claviceps sp. LM458 group G5]KAG6033418.1 hypothetical protein E4U19_006549 [Claviceps sp. Clav32 group G5]KAG6044794.1 hypothetical protein E4U39_003015 [Claviceps sp. Clav50 group G5]